MTRLSWLVPILVTARTVAAQPGLEEPVRAPPPPADAHVFAGAGLLTTVDHLLNVAYMVDGGVRIGDLPVWIHGMAAKGGALDADDGGGYWRLTAGVESRSCWTDGNCMFGGLDAGYEHQTWGQGSEAETHRGAVIAARAGFDLGGDHVRFRAAFELYEYHREFVEGQMTAWQLGGGPSITLAYRM